MSKNKKKRTNKNKKTAKRTKAKKPLAKKADSIAKATIGDDSADKTAGTEEDTQNQPSEKPSEKEETNAQQEVDQNKATKATKAFDSPAKVPVPKRRTTKPQTSSADSSTSKPEGVKKSKLEKNESDNPKKEHTTGNSPFIVVPEKSADNVKVEKKPAIKRTAEPTTPPPSEKPVKANLQEKNIPTDNSSSETPNDLGEVSTGKVSKKDVPRKTSDSGEKAEDEKTILVNKDGKKIAASSSPEVKKKPTDAKQEEKDTTKKLSEATPIIGPQDKAEDALKEEKRAVTKTDGSRTTDAEEKEPIRSEKNTAEKNSSTQEQTKSADADNKEQTELDDSKDTNPKSVSEKSASKNDTGKPTNSDIPKNTDSSIDSKTIPEEKTTEKSISAAPTPGENQDDVAGGEKNTETAKKKTIDSESDQEATSSATTKLDSKDSSDQEANAKKEGQEKEPTEVSKEASDEEEIAVGSKKSQVLRSKLKSSSPRRRYLLTTAAVILGFYVVLTSAWAFDSARHSGRAPRGTHIGNVNVSGMKEADVQKETKKFADQLSEKTITLKADEATVKVSPEQLGAEVDTEALAAAAFKNSSKAFLPVRPVKWLGNVFSAKSVVTPEYNIDEKKLIKLTDELLGSQIDGPKEPGITLINNKLDATAGESGKEIDTTSLLTDVEAVITQGKPATINLPTKVSEPKVTLETAKKLASEADKVTGEPIALTALDQKIQVSPKTLKKWIAVAEVDEEQTWVIDQEVATDELKDLFGELGVVEEKDADEETDDDEVKEPLTPQFTVVNNKPILLPVADTITCCDDNTAAKIKEVLLSEPAASEEVVFPEYETMADQCKKDETRGNVEISDEVIRRGELDIAFIKKDPEYEKLSGYGIIEEISTCTTAHTGGNRSVNIKNFAAAMNGKIIEPQSQISLNEEVGRRTRAKGYLPAGAINGGSSTDDEIGGGISQFATTFFNASFFGGLDLVAFKPHSQYFSRYPYALESTISWGGPEVISGNPTDQGVLVWTEFTNSSVTVTFYSTKSVEVEASAPKRWTRGICQMGSIERIIDGKKDSKEVVAEYRKDGFDCNGNPSAAKQKELAEEAARQQQAARPQPTPTPNPNPTPPSSPFIEN